MICSLFRGRRVHLMGIGGAGVSALVPLLREVGAEVSGCDNEPSELTSRLQAEGVPVDHRHSPEHCARIDLIVHTAAVDRDHPELAAARRRGIPVLTRGECLMQLMAGTRTIAISGSHGKTSTTWMTGHLLTEAGADPVVMVGGSVASLGGGGSRAGHSDWFVAETDESDGSFALIDAEVAVVTNLDREHLRHYGGFAGLEDAFQAWLARVPHSGAVIVPNEGLSPRVLERTVARIIRCGLDAGDVHAAGLELGPDGSRCRVVIDGAEVGEITVPLPGAHMVHNALMAVAAARWACPGIDLGALARCERVRRRFTVHGSPQGIRVVEDYGHHPAEVRATIAAARLGGGRVHVIFQPHRYTRTADSFDDFTSAFDQAHGLALMPIYAASEQPIPGIESRSLAQAVRLRRREGVGDTVAYVEDGEAAIRFIAGWAAPGDTVLVLGAGDVGRLAGPLVDFFRRAVPQSGAVQILSRERGPRR